MRSRTLVIGLVLVVSGIYLSYWGSSVVTTLAVSVGNPSTKLEPHKPLLLMVEPNNYTYITTPISTDTLHALHGSLAATGEVSLYIMNQTDYNVWRSGKPTSVELSVTSATNRNFTLTPDRSGTYYFVLDNRESDKAKSVTLNLSEEVNTVDTSPMFDYLPAGFILIGVILVMLGLGGKKTPKPE
ncbi:MAG: hypothetical protein M1503_01990 [Thaumarchaeota archaeon]|nr:hypothetical protein [Nitrososphaerota archaeon]MCL5317022.1 hypothetical protein [Nitrososphaerota archaeon]